MIEIKAEYDKLISTPIENKDKEIIGYKEHHHFIFGSIGSVISGGFYIRKGTEIPESILLKVPEV